ncbi:unnamed protein product [Urochloa humidicola]
MKSASALATAFPVSMKGEAFPVSMKGQRVRVQRPYFECRVSSSLKKRDEGKHSSTLLELKSSIGFPTLSLGEKLLLEGYGLRCHCSVCSLPQAPVKTEKKEEDQTPVKPKKKEEDQGVWVSVQDCEVWPCSACASLELPMPIPLPPDGLEDKTVRLCRLGPQNIEVTEARVTEIEGRRPSCSIVHLEIRASPPAFCMGDLLVLESLDGQRQWEADVRSDVQWEAYGRSDPDSKSDDIHNGSRFTFISVYVRTAEANSDPRLFQQKPMVILVEPVPNSTYHLTDNGRGAALSKISKATVNETHIDAAKPKIKIGIHGYGSTGRAMARIALESKDVELVAINDSSITMDQMTCMFRDSHEHGHWLSSDFKIKDEDHNTLMFGDKEVTIFRVKESRKIPWKEAGAEYIVEARADQSSADYYKTRTSNYVHYIDMKDNVFKNHLFPLAKILHNRFGEVEDVACRAPVLKIIPQNPNAAKAICEVLAHWNGHCNAMIFRVPAVDLPPVDMAIELAEYKGYRLIPCNTKPSFGFCMVLAWCVEMTRQISKVSYCELIYG